ncbi:MAG TPA: ABC transporter substrate-binding protein, partial [Firmicutes bacterium]|nr:ABC transporter substrate-binding protein [Bacillota bacterium]
EQTRWINFVRPIQEDFVKEMAVLGLDGSGALKVAKKLADKYNAIYK